MEEIDVIGSALLELKKKDNTLQKSLDKLDVEKIDLLEKIELLFKKVDEISDSQKENEKRSENLNRMLLGLDRSVHELSDSVGKKLDSLENLKVNRIELNDDLKKFKEALKTIENLDKTTSSLERIVHELDDSTGKRVEALENLNTTKGELNDDLKKFKEALKTIENLKSFENDAKKNASVMNDISTDILLLKNDFKKHFPWEDLDELKKAVDLVKDKTKKEDELIESRINEKLNPIISDLRRETIEMSNLPAKINEVESILNKNIDHGVYPKIYLLADEQELLKQKLKQMETSFNVQVRSSSSMHQSLRQDVNKDRDNITNLSRKLEGINENLHKTMHELHNYEGLTDGRLTKQKDDISSLIRDVSQTENKFYETLDKVKRDLREDASRKANDIFKTISDIKRDKDAKENRRIERMNETIKEFIARKAKLEEKIELLSANVNKFHELKNSFKKEFTSQAERIVGSVEDRQNYQDKNIFVLTQEMKQLSKDNDKMEMKISELNKEIIVWKEKYRLQLGRLADEVDTE